MADWRDQMIEKLMPILKEAGITTFDREKILAKIHEIAGPQRDLPKEERWGCSYCVDHYTERGMNAMLNKIAKDGYGIDPTPPKPAKAKGKSGEGEGPAPQPPPPESPTPPLAPSEAPPPPLGPPQPPTEG